MPQPTTTATTIPLSFPAIVAEVPHPDELAIAALSEQFGVYKFVDFETGLEGKEGKREKRNSGSTMASSAAFVAVAAVARQILG